MTPRELRKKRRQWKVNSKNYRKSKENKEKTEEYMANNSPPESPASVTGNDNPHVPARPYKPAENCEGLQGQVYQGRRYWEEKLKNEISQKWQEKF